MMRPHYIFGAVLIWIIHWYGCAQIPAKPDNGYQQSAQQYYEAARRQHDLHNYEQALLYLQTARALDPQNPIFTQTLQDMRLYYDAMATHHLEQGFDEARNGDQESARSQWMRALRYNPNNSLALEKLYGEHTRGHVYHTQAGDTPADVAEQIYNLKEWSKLVAFLYPPDADGFYTTQRVLWLPILDARLQPQKPAPLKAKASKKAPLKSVFPKPLAPKKALPTKAEAGDQLQQEISGPVVLQNLFREGQYADVIVHARHFSVGELTQEGVPDIVNRSRYYEAQNLLAEGKVLQARFLINQIRMEQIDPQGLPVDLASLKNEIDNTIQLRAHNHFKLGLDHYVHERLSQAITEWQTVLVYRPEHPQARMGIQNAQRLIEALKRIK